jgi:hypothetical protein
MASLSRISPLRKHTSARPIMLQTALAATFLRALLRWAQRHSRGGPIALASGRVGGDELHRVVVTVVCATQERGP